MSLVKVSVYETDSLRTWVRPAEDYDSFYELSETLLTDFQRAEAALGRARAAITEYIEKQHVTKVDPW